MNPETLTALDRELKALPLRPAPRTLVTRVEAALAAQAALPWWHRSWAYWPIGARAGAAAVSVAGLAVVSVGFEAAWRGVDFAALLATRLPWLGTARYLGQLTLDIGASVLRATPDSWIYALVGAGFVSAALLATATTAAVRALRFPPQP